MSVCRPQAEVLDEYRGQHQVRERGRVAAEQAVDIFSFQVRIGERRFGRRTHEIERGATGQLAEGS